MKTYGWLFAFVGMSAMAQVQQMQQRGGISFVTRRVPMVVPEIQANQFFAAGGVNLAPRANIGGQPFGGAGFGAPGQIQTGPFLAEDGTPLPPYPTQIQPAYTYRIALAPASSASARKTASKTGSSETTQVVAVVGSTIKVVTVPAEH
jgi:hypothetical protein